MSTFEERVSSVALEDHQAFERAIAEYLDAHPGVKRPDVWGPFSAAWHARVRVARESVGRYSETPHEAMVSYLVQKLEDHIQHLDKLTLNVWRGARARTRDIDSLRHMLKEKKLDPRDAPAWRRISEQRKEIRRLTKENDRLRGQIVRIEGESS